MVFLLVFGKGEVPQRGEKDDSLLFEILEILGKPGYMVTEGFGDTIFSFQIIEVFKDQFPRHIPDPLPAQAYTVRFEPTERLIQSVRAGARFYKSSAAA